MVNVHYMHVHQAICKPLAFRLFYQSLHFVFVYVPGQAVPSQRWEDPKNAVRQGCFSVRIGTTCQKHHIRNKPEWGAKYTCMC